MKATSKNGVIITIANNKGGTGKTTIATHLGVGLTRFNKKVLVIDNDPQCNATKLLTYDMPRAKTMYDLLSSEATVELSQFLTATRTLGLQCITNVTATSGLTLKFHTDYPNCFFLLQKLIREQAQEMFDFVLIDCPPTLDIPMGMALCASDAVIIPVTVSSLHSLDGLTEVLELIEAMQEHNPDLKFMKIVMNMADRRTSISKLMIDDIQTLYPGHHFKTIIPVSTSIQQAEYMRKTVFEIRNNKGAFDYKKLAKEIIEEVK